MFYYAKFQVSNLNLIFLQPTWVAILGNSPRVIKKLFNSVLSAHRLRDSAKFGVCSFYGVREMLSGHDIQTDRRMDMAKSIFLVMLIKNIYTL